MQPTTNDLMRIILCLEGRVKSEIYSSINSLLLYSVNYSQPVHLDNLQELVEAITDFMYFAVNSLPDYHSDLKEVLDEFIDQSHLKSIHYDQYGDIEL